MINNGASIYPAMGWKIDPITMDITVQIGRNMNMNLKHLLVLTDNAYIVLLNTKYNRMNDCRINK